MYKSSTEIKVGLFVLAALGLFVWMAVRLGGFGLSVKDTYNISTVFPSAVGLKQGVAVEVAGIQVGTVASIELYDDKQARVVMAIQDGIRLPADSAAFIRSSGLLGDKYVELAPGGGTQEKLEAGGQIAAARAAADVSDVMQQLGEIAADLKKITAPLAEGNTGSDLKDLISNLKDMSERLSGIVSANEAGLTETLAALNGSMTNLQEITDKINSGSGSLGRLINDDSTVRELNQSLASIRHITGRIEAGEGTLGRLISDDGTIDKVDRALSSLTGYLEKEDKFKVFVEYRADYLTRHDFLKSTINLRLQPGPDRYYLLGVTGDYFGKYKRSDFRSTDANGVVRNSIEEEWRRDKLKFNAQIARRYYDMVVRGGLIESGAGLGLDYYLDEDKLRLTLEAFSGDFDERPHLRAEASYNIWKIFYFNLGYDDFISDQHRASPYFGLGLRFNDDDLKYLLSGASSLF
ncbi:MAG: MlaD family protein [Candidatus Adiutrix sp.]|jgi:phospholipid/cholesterol/gamma-HCH transport system substrate-binding protein|nr:MlaD family protein [Candidatus Adiutrix sp.]